MNIIIRKETEQDRKAVEQLTREAFWNLYVPGCDEHYLCHVLREHPDFIADLCLVAEVDGEIVGSIMYSWSQLLSEGTDPVKTVSFGPLCVHPDFQRKGVGTALINTSRTLVEALGIPAIIIYGDPHNYCKHGFKNGVDYRVSDETGEYPLGLLVLELKSGFFGQHQWQLKQSDVFDLDPEAANLFDQQFVAKEKQTHYSQELFSILIRARLTAPDGV